MTTCPAYDICGGYVSRCIRPTGHDGDHLASDLEPIDTTDLDTQETR